MGINKQINKKKELKSLINKDFFTSVTEREFEDERTKNMCVKCKCA